MARPSSSRADGIGSMLFRERSPDAGADIVFTVEDKNIWAHSVVVKKRSRVFAALFGGQFREATELKTCIEDCAADDFEAFLQLLYTGEFQSTPRGAVALAASKRHTPLRQSAELQLLLRIAKMPLDAVVSQARSRKMQGFVVHTDEDGGIWIKFHGKEQADRFSLEIAQTFPNATLTVPSTQEVDAAISSLSRVFAVMKLLDRYNVDGFAACVCEQLKVFLVWGYSFFHTMTVCFSLPEGTEFRTALWELCQAYALRNDEQAVFQFMAFHSASMPIWLSTRSVELRAALQILTWQSDWVNDNEGLLGGDAIFVRRTISLCVQEVLKAWATFPEVQIPGEPEQKRRRIDA